MTSGRAKHSRLANVCKTTDSIDHRLLHLRVFPVVDEDILVAAGLLLVVLELVVITVAISKGTAEAGSALSS